jgi:hypothetical protein
MKVICPKHNICPYKSNYTKDGWLHGMKCLHAEEHEHSSKCKESCSRMKVDIVCNEIALRKTKLDKIKAETSS